MKLRRVYAIFIRQMFLLRYNKTRFVNIFLWAALDIVLWGFITKYFSLFASSSTVSLVGILLGAIIFWDFLIRVQQGIMLSFLEDVWSQNFLNLFSSPLTIKEYVAGLILTSIITSTAGLLFMLVLAGVLFGYNIFILGLNFLFFLSILFLFGVALGIVAIGIVFRLGPAAEWFAWPVPFVLAPFAAIYYPVSALPPFAQYIAMFVPPSYAFEGMRSILNTGTVDYDMLFIGLGLAALFLVGAYFFFVFVYRYVLKTGLLVRFSAENIS